MHLVPAFIRDWYNQTIVLPKLAEKAGGLLDGLRPALEVYLESLRSVQRRLVDPATEKLDLLVEFFGITSPWHDHGFDEIAGAYQLLTDQKSERVYAALVVLASRVRTAGRNKYGWNRTQIGEPVTPDKVFLGNIYGLFTKPIPDWQIPHLKTDNNGPSLPMIGDGSRQATVYEIIVDQAMRFMESHVGTMIKQLEIILGKNSEMKKAA